MDYLAIGWMLLVFCTPIVITWLGWKVWKAENATAPMRSNLTFGLAIITSLSLVFLFVTAGTLISQMPY